MCGITGIIQQGANADRDTIERMTATLAHRGPDDHSLFLEGHVGLGHRRLAILDLSPRGRQPMTYEYQARRLVLTFNGEIYNFRELRTELRRLGYPFATGTDSEVILAAYHAYGPACVERLNGMFAFGLYDHSAQTLFLARDRLGVKPLYYTETGTEPFAFASELKAFRILRSPREIDETALYDFFTYGFVPAPKSLYRSIRKLLPGHTLTIDTRTGRRTLHRYWQPTLDQRRESPQAVRERVDALLTDAVSCRLVADVPIGLFLSAGMDSSTVAWYLRDQRLTCLHVDFGDEQTETVARFAEMLHLPLNVVHVAEEAYDRHRAQRVYAHFDEPFADNSAYPTDRIARAAQEQGLKVVVTGDGGDELFFGYRRYRTLGGYTALGRWRLRPAVRAFAKITGSVAPSSRLHKGLTYLALRDIRAFWVKMNGGFTREEKCHFLDPSFLRRFRDYDDYWLFDRSWPSDPALPLLKRVQYFDLQTSLPDDILVKADRMAMRHGVELRSPFLDYRLTEYVLSLDLQSIFPGQRLKGVLRDLMAGRLPPELIRLPKRGFGFNVNRALADPMLPLRPDAMDFFLRRRKIAYLNAFAAIHQTNR